MGFIRNLVQQQVEEVLARGQRFDRFDQIRQRHFWSSHLFAYGAGNLIPAGPYDIFKTIPSGIGQGYPVPLTLRETNWLNVGRVPDNQNVVISEIGVTIKRPPSVNNKDEEVGPSNGIFANLPAGIQALIEPAAVIHPSDAQAILSGIVLNMTYLTNRIPIGLALDFSQSAGQICYSSAVSPMNLAALDGADVDDTQTMGDPINGIAAAAFRRKLEVPIMLQHGESMGMSLEIPRPIQTVPLAGHGAGWCEIRVDWWGIESFVEKS